jgi:hypothetical protein
VFAAIARGAKKTRTITAVRGEGFEILGFMARPTIKRFAQMIPKWIIHQNGEALRRMNED